MKFYDYESFEIDIKILARKIRDDFDPDAIVGIARGGMTLAHCLSTALDNRHCFTLNSIHYENTKKLDTINIFNIPDLNGYKKILLVDDIVDSGETITAIKKELASRFDGLEFKVATIYYKPNTLIMPDFSVKEADDWMEFFWDVKL